MSKKPKRKPLTRKQELAKIDDMIAKVRAEVIRATKLHGAFHSAHEGYGVLAEEFHELFLEIIANKPRRQHAEAVQVAAMAVRFLIDV